MPGPAPKPPSQRQRRNRTATATRMEAPPATKVPLPIDESDWQPVTLRWWDTIWDSPMAGEWVDADVPGLLALAALVDAFWASRDPKIAAELRLQQREFGLSPLSRRQLQWEVHRVEQATKSRPAISRPKPRGRAILSVLTGRAS